MSESLGSELTLDDDFCSDIPEEDELDSSNSSGDFKHTFPKSEKRHQHNQKHQNGKKWTFYTY